MSQDSTSKKAIVNILYPCILCGGEYPNATEVIRHIKLAHGYIMVPRPTGYHRPVDKQYDYENAIGGKWDVQHYGCPSCWFHAPKDPETILDHVMNTHKPHQSEGFTPRDENEEDELYEEQSDQEDVQKNKESAKDNNNKEGDDNERNEKDTGSNEPTKDLSSIFKDEKELVREVYKILIETTTMFKNLTKGTSKK